MAENKTSIPGFYPWNSSKQIVSVKKKKSSCFGVNVPTLPIHYNVHLVTFFKDSINSWSCFSILSYTIISFSLTFNAVCSSKKWIEKSSVNISSFIELYFLRNSFLQIQFFFQLQLNPIRSSARVISI